MTVYACDQCGVLMSDSSNIDVVTKRSTGHHGPIVSSYELKSPECPGCGEQRPQLNTVMD